MVQKKIGRPKEFDCDAVLAAAVEVFWLKGYDGASLTDLTEAMGINRPSLYASFGDKRSLYLKAIEVYAKGVGSDPIRAFEAQGNPREAITAYFKKQIEAQCRSGAAAKGCLLGSCATSSVGDFPEIRKFLSEGIQADIKRLEANFENFKQADLLPACFPSHEKAKLVLDIMHGFSFQARLEECRDKLMDDVEQKVTQVLSRVSAESA